MSRGAPHAWCRKLAEANPDHIGAVLRSVAEKLRADNLPSLPDLSEIVHTRESLSCENGTHVWLHIAFVMDPGTNLPERVDLRAEDACIRACEPWVGSLEPIFHIYRPGDARLARYHRVSAGVPVPTPPVKAPVPVREAVPAVPVKRVVDAEPVTTPPKASTQGSLF